MAGGVKTAGEVGTLASYVEVAAAAAGVPA